MKKLLILPCFFYILLFSNVSLAEGAGISLSYLGTKIDVRYNDNVNDKLTGVEYIREPSGALFDLIYLLQHSNILDKPKTIEVEIDNYGGSLWIYKSKPNKTVLLDIGNLNALSKQEITKTLCKELGSSKCIPDKNATIDLYLSNLYLARKKSDLIEFGCFPCRNDTTIALTDIYKDTTEENMPKFKKVSVNKTTIYKYFNVLRD